MQFCFMVAILVIAGVFFVINGWAKNRAFRLALLGLFLVIAINAFDTDPGYWLIVYFVIIYGLDHYLEYLAYYAHPEPFNTPIDMEEIEI